MKQEYSFEINNIKDLSSKEKDFRKQSLDLFLYENIFKQYIYIYIFDFFLTYTV